MKEHSYQELMKLVESKDKPIDMRQQIENLPIRVLAKILLVKILKKLGKK